MIEKLSHIEYLRDIQLAQPIKYPTIDIDIDRTRAAQMNVTLNDISRSLVAATSSSRFTEKNVWIDPRSNISYSVQVEIAENQMNSMNDINEIPVLSNESRPVLGDVADIKSDTSYGENDNLGALPFLSVTANLNKKDLGTATKDVQEAIKSIGEIPRGLSIETKGLSEVLTETLNSLQVGLLTAIAVIFLMLAANFQSFKVSLVVLSTLPAVLLGSLAALAAYRLNAQFTILYGHHHVRRGFHCQFCFDDHKRGTFTHAWCECPAQCKRIGGPAHAADLDDQCGHGSGYAADGIRLGRRRRSGRTAGPGSCWRTDRFYFCRAD